jgi:hypothetical protein
VDLYHIWCNLKSGTSDVGFCESVAHYLGHLQRGQKIRGYRITRRKLGLGPGDLGEFHIAVEVEDLAQLERAFQAVSERSDPIEELHVKVNQLATDVRFALYRDFPDPQRHRGQERF